MHLLAETEGDLNNYSELTYTDAAEGMHSQFGLNQSMHSYLLILSMACIEHGLCCCLVPGSSFQSPMPRLLLDYDRNCDLDAYCAHHMSNGSLLPSQQDRSDLLKAREFDTGSAHESDVSVSNMFVRLSFGFGSVYESDLSSSTVRCSVSELGSSHGPDIPFFAGIAIGAEYAHGFGPPTSNVLPLATEAMCGRGIPRSVDTVCLSYGTRFALESDLHVSNEIPSESKSAHGSEKSCSTDTVCLPFEHKTAHQSDILDSIDTSCLPCEPGSASASVVPFLIETRCIQFDCDTVHEPAIAFSVGTLFGFGFANESDIVDLTNSVNLPFELGPAYASDDAYSSKIPFEPESACEQKRNELAPISGGLSQRHGDGAHTSFKQQYCDLEERCKSDQSSHRLQIIYMCRQFTTSINGNPANPSQSHGDNAQISSKLSHVSDAGVHGDHNASISAWEHQLTCVTVSEYIPCDAPSRPTCPFTMQHHDWSRLMAETNGSDPASSSVQITNQPTCSQVAASIDDSLFESYADDGQSSPSFSCNMRHHDLSMLMTEYYSSESAQCVGQITNQPTCSQVEALINSRCVFQSYGDDATQSEASDAGAHMTHNDSILGCKPASTYGTVCGTTTRIDSLHLVRDATTHNGTDHDALNANDAHELSENGNDDVKDIPVGASLSADHKWYNPVFDFVFATSCVGLVLFFACSLLQWYCCPKKLEERPECGCPHTRSDCEVLETKPQVYLVSKRLRRCVALANIRKRFRAWRIDTKNEKYDRSDHVIGAAFLLIVMFQPVVEGSAVVSMASSSTNMTQHHDETALVNATNVHTDMNQLAAFNDADLKEFLGSLAVEQRELKRANVHENAEIKAENEQIRSTVVDIQKENAEIKKENVVIRKENAEVKNEIAEIQVENTDLRMKNDQDYFRDSQHVNQNLFLGSDETQAITTRTSELGARFWQPSSHRRRAQHSVAGSCTADDSVHVEVGAVFEWTLFFETTPESMLAFYVDGFQPFTPVEVAGLGADNQAVAAGPMHTVYLKTDGRVFAAGLNEGGQLGDGTYINRPTPVEVVGVGADNQAVAAGYTHTVYLKADGRVFAAGANEGGQLGDGTTINRPTPVEVVGVGADNQAIAAGGVHTVYLKADGRVFAAGWDGPTPVEMAGVGADNQAVAAGGMHTVYLKTDGRVFAAGLNEGGQLGDGTYIDRPTPVEVVGVGADNQAVAAGYTHTVYLKTDGRVFAAGLNDVGQLGDGTYINRSTPVEVVGVGADNQAVAAGGMHTVYLKADGRVFAAGADNVDRLGNGTYIDGPTPVEVVVVGADNQAIAAGWERTVYLKVGSGTCCAWVPQSDGASVRVCCTDFSAVASVVDGSCTACNGIYPENCTSATCADGFVGYSNGYCCSDFSNVPSVVDGSCTACRGDQPEECTSATCADGFVGYGDGFCCTEFTDVPSVVDGSCTACSGDRPEECTSATCAAGFSSTYVDGHCCSDVDFADVISVVDGS
eukprot:SAG31_NODE_870_length_11338_cov_14.525047_11_plen_1486_part_01